MNDNNIVNDFNMKREEQLVAEQNTKALSDILPDDTPEDVFKFMQDNYKVMNAFQQTYDQMALQIHDLKAYAHMTSQEKEFYRQCFYVCGRVIDASILIAESMKIDPVSAKGGMIMAVSAMIYMVNEGDAEKISRDAEVIGENIEAQIHEFGESIAGWEQFFKKVKIDDSK